MGIICIILGLVILGGSIGGGYLLSSAIVASQDIRYLLGLDAINDPLIFAIVMGICAFIGLLLCLNLVMNGLIYNRLSKVNANTIKAYKAAKRATRENEE